MSPAGMRALAVCLWLAGGAAWAEIVTDGSMGLSTRLTGPDYAVSAVLGRQEGSNLFHSFRDFSLSAGESATFSGPGNLQNILSRVTGGQTSRIDGTLRSTVAGAAVYLMNPAGIVFGPHARLEIPGAFHAAAADELRLQDGGVFPARTDAPSVLSSAPPAAFGFLAAQPAALEVSGSRLQAQGEMRLAGGEIRFAQAELSVPGGSLSLQAVGAIDLRESRLSTSGAGGGTIRIEAGRLQLHQSRIEADSLQDQAGGGIDLRAGAISLEAGSEITSRSLGSGAGGDIALDAETLSLRGWDTDGHGSRIAANTESSEPGAGDGGALRIRSGALSLEDGGQLQAATWGQGQGGDMRVEIAGQAKLRGQDLAGNPSGIYLTSGGARDPSAPLYAAGHSGTLVLQAGELALQDGAVINASSYGTGQGGDLQIEVAGRLNLSGYGTDGHGSGISANAAGYVPGAGNGGNLALRAGELVLQDGAQISAGTGGGGQGGSLRVEISGAAELAGEDPAGYSSGLYTATESAQAGAGRGGSLALRADSLGLREGAAIRADTSGSGQGGDIALEVAGELALDGESASAKISRISANTYSQEQDAGKGGDIEVRAGRLGLSKGAQIGSSSFGPGQGGAVSLRVAGPVSLDGEDRAGYPGGIYTAAADYSEAGGDGGSLRLEAGALSLRDGAVINASTYGGGQGGAVSLRVDGPVELSGSGQWGNGCSIGTTAQGYLWPAGAGGTVELSAAGLSLQDGGQIAVGTTGPGAGGDARLSVQGETALAGSDASGFYPSGVFSTSSGFGNDAGPAGNIALSTDRLEIGGNARISAATQGPGRGGDLRLVAREVLLRDGGGITAGSEGQGEAGTIELSVGERQVMRDGVLETRTRGADGGNISLSSPGYLYLVDSALTTSVQDEAGRSGNGGDILLAPEFILLDRSRIVARAVGGNGGDIDIRTTAVYPFSPSPIDAVSVFGEDGTVTIDAPDINIVEALEVVPGGFLGQADLAGEACSQRQAGEAPSRLITVNYGGSPPGPEDWEPSGFPAENPMRNITY